MKPLYGLLAIGFGLSLICRSVSAAGPSGLSAFRFQNAAAVREWAATHDISSITPTPEGMRIVTSGGDPYTVGPARDYPVGKTLWLQIRLRADESGSGQVFWTRSPAGFSEAASEHFNVPGGRWVTVRLALPPLGPTSTLRLDPPCTCTIASMVFSERILLKEPAWPKPVRASVGRGALRMRSGSLELLHSRTRFGAFEVRSAGSLMACGQTPSLVGYLIGGKQRWFRMGDRVTSAALASGRFTVSTTARDPDGATWSITRVFGRGSRAGSISVNTTVRCSAVRDAVYLPMLMIHPGLGSFGAERDHGLLAGLEYLDRQDTSSSEADIIGPGSKRQVPDTERITFPLMAVVNGGKWVALSWQMGPELSAVYDSPDRLFGSGAHVMGVIFPGSDGVNRVEGNLLPYHGQSVGPNTPVRLHAVLLGGEGNSVIPAVQAYVALKGFPAVPSPGMSRSAYTTWAAGGWLDSKIGEGGLYRHAYWPGISSFAPGPAADAAMWITWLALATRDSALAGRLDAAAAEALAHVAPGSYNSAGIGHVRYPAPALLFGGVAENVAAARERAMNELGRFEPDGTLLYRKPIDRVDYGRTHFAPDANGLTAVSVADVLSGAIYTGDQKLRTEGLRLLRALDKFDDTAPRGAQTWEVPLHTPDILASAHLVRAYTLGYQITGDREFLQRAIYWAWTGVPFTYLVKPTPNPVGLYGTTPVFGATGWQAPDWMGLPVQWCGLVYADALYWLAREDQGGPWRKLADGITASGILQSWPTSDRDLQGLLPDSFAPHTQTRNAVAINPGTVESCAVRLFGGPAVYDYAVLRQARFTVHAPGAIEVHKETPAGASLSVRGWSGKPYYVLVAGLLGEPTVRVNGSAVTFASGNEYLAQDGCLILQVTGSPTIDIETGRL